MRSFKLPTNNAEAFNEKLSSLLVNKFGENSKFTITYRLEDKFITVNSENLEIINFLKVYQG